MYSFKMKEFSVLNFYTCCVFSDLISYILQFNIIYFSWISVFIMICVGVYNKCCSGTISTIYFYSILLTFLNMSIKTLNNRSNEDSNVAVLSNKIRTVMLPIQSLLQINKAVSILLFFPKARLDFTRHINAFDCLLIHS